MNECRYFQCGVLEVETQQDNFDPGLRRGMRKTRSKVPLLIHERSRSAESASQEKSVERGRDGWISKWPQA